MRYFFQVAVAVVCSLFRLTTALCERGETFVFDAFHGENPAMRDRYSDLLPREAGVKIIVNYNEIGERTLADKRALILINPVKTLGKAEKKAIVAFLSSGGSLLLCFDEERRTPLRGVGINDLIVPFGIELTGDVRVRHNCGAVAEKSEVCSGRRELPYSGGRSIKGGTVISRVYDEGDFVHCAYATTPGGGKIIVMSDGMASLLLGRADGIRFDGTGPGDSKYWGKDGVLFMKEIFTFLLKN